MNEPSTLDMALFYAERGLRVVPVWSVDGATCTCPEGAACRSPGKHPTIKAWEREASTDKRQLHAWFKSQRRNIGIACGPSSIVTIDIDPRSGGNETFAALIAELGPLPATMTDDSGGGGVHYSFKRPAGDLVGKLGDGVDFLRDGRQFLVEPSIHPSGGRYTWRAGLGPSEIELADLPPAWVDRLTRKATPRAPRAPQAQDTNRVVDRARKYVAKMDHAIANAGGHDATYAVVAALLMGFDLSESDAWPLLLEYNDRCDPPWSERELRHKVTSCLKTSTRERGYLLGDQNYGLPSGLTVIDRPSPTPSVVAAAREVPPARYGVPVDEWLGDEEPDEDDSSDWHVRGVIARDVAQFVAGDPKVGKTMMMESLAIALAMGAPTWCGFEVYGRKRVLVMPREDSQRTTRQRLWQLARGAGLSGPRELSKWLSIDPTTPLNLRDQAHVEMLRNACERFDVIIIDSFTTAHVGDENSSKDVAAALEPLRDLAIGTKTTIAVIHHYNGKGNADDKRGVKHRLRGSSAIAGYARHIVGVSHGPKRGMIEIASDGNLEYQLAPTLIELVKGTTDAGKNTLAYRLIGAADEAALTTMRDDVVALVAAADDGFSSSNAIVKELGTNRKLALKAVKSELLVPVGRLEKIGKRIYARNSVPGTSGNQSEPQGGSGSAPYRALPGTGARNEREIEPEYWDR